MLNRVIAIPITRTDRGIPTEVALTHDMGMPADCVLSTDNISVIDKAYCTSRITTLTAVIVEATCHALSLAIDC